MNKNLIVIIALVASSQFATATETTGNSPTPKAKIESSLKTDTKKGKEAASAEAPQKKKKSFFAIFDFIGRIKEFVGVKSKQNENAIEDAANGAYQPRTKRALAADPKTRAIQEKLDKLQTERLKKYETD